MRLHSPWTPFPWRRGGAGLAAGALLGIVLGGAGGVRAQERQEPAGEHYGNAPEQALPFRTWGDPYRELLNREPTYPGPDRGIPEPVHPASVRLGVIAPLEGSRDEARGQSILRGIRLAIEEANEAGGHDGIPFELVVRNDRAIWGATANEMVGLTMRDQVVAVLGTVDGANSHVALRVALKLGIAMVNTACTDPTLTETMIPWIVRVVPDDRQNGYRMARFLFEERGVKRVAAIRANDRYGRLGIQEFADAARRWGRPLRQELRYQPGERGLAAQIGRVLRAKPDAVVLWGSAEDAGHVTRRLREEGFTGLVVGTDRCVDPRFLQEAGAAAEGVFATYPYDPQDPSPRWDAFETRFRARWNEAPDAFAGYGYDGARMLVEAVNEAGLNRARIRDALYATRVHEGVTGTIRLDPSGTNRAPVRLLECRGGTFRPVAPPRRSASLPPASLPTASLPPASLPPASLPPAPPPPAAPPGTSLGASLARSAGGETAPLRIGVFLPQDAAAARAIREGAEQAARAVARDGTRGAVPAPELEIVIREDGGPWGRGAAEAARLLAEPGLVAAIAPRDRVAAHVLGQVATRGRVPLLALTPMPSLAAAGSPWVFAGQAGRKGPGGSPAGRDDLRGRTSRAVRAIAEAAASTGGRPHDVRDHLAREGWQPIPLAAPPDSKAPMQPTGGGPHGR